MPTFRRRKSSEANKMTPETAANWISLVFLAGMMGALRQVVRSVAG